MEENIGDHRPPALWSVLVRGREHGEEQTMAEVAVARSGRIWVSIGFRLDTVHEWSASGEFTVDMARDLRAAIDEAIERASAE